MPPEIPVDPTDIDWNADFFTTDTTANPLGPMPPMPQFTHFREAEARWRMDQMGQIRAETIEEAAMRMMHKQAKKGIKEPSKSDKRKDLAIKIITEKRPNKKDRYHAHVLLDDRVVEDYTYDTPEEISEIASGLTLRYMDSIPPPDEVKHRKDISVKKVRHAGGHFNRDVRRDVYPIGLTEDGEDKFALDINEAVVEKVEKKVKPPVVFNYGVAIDETIF